MTDYHLILLDNYDWSYVDSTKKDVVERINCFSGGSVLCDSVYTMIIIDTNGQSPESAVEILNKIGIKFDTAYSQTLPESSFALVQYFQAINSNKVHRIANLKLEDL